MGLGIYREPQNKSHEDTNEQSGWWCSNVPESEPSLLGIPLWKAYFRVDPSITRTHCFSPAKWAFKESLCVCLCQCWNGSEALFMSLETGSPWVPSRVTAGKSMGAEAAILNRTAFSTALGRWHLRDTEPDRKKPGGCNVSSVRPCLVWGRPGKADSWIKLWLASRKQRNKKTACSYQALRRALYEPSFHHLYHIDLFF